jgi:hypothetical protein
LERRRLMENGQIRPRGSVAPKTRNRETLDGFAALYNLSLRLQALDTLISLPPRPLWSESQRIEFAGIIATMLAEAEMPADPFHRFVAWQVLWAPVTIRDANGVMPLPVSYLHESPTGGISVAQEPDSDEDEQRMMRKAVRLLVPPRKPLP